MKKIKELIHTWNENDKKPLTEWQKGFFIGSVGSITLFLLIGGIVLTITGIQLP